MKNISQFTLTLQLSELLALLIFTYQFGYYHATKSFLLGAIKDFSIHMQQLALCNIALPEQNHINENLTIDNKSNNELTEPPISLKHSNYLDEKFALDLNKLNSTSFFQMRFESTSNHKFMRKIQKHEIITDYSVQNGLQQTRILHHKSPTALPNDSILSIVVHQNKKQQIYAQKIVKMHNIRDCLNNFLPHSILQNGKFQKMFTSHKIIGQGGYGKVYSAISVLEGKGYAIKKIYVSQKSNLTQLMNQANIISHYNHPSIVRFYTCWIELANVDETIQIQQFLQTSKKYSKSQSSHLVQINYQEQSNSAFTFEKNSQKSQQKESFKESNNSSICALSADQKTLQIVQIYTLYIQMELEDESLSEYLKSRQSVIPQQAFYIFDQILSGVNFLHSNGIVHRDLKPGNILLNKERKTIKIGDFGLSALINNQNSTFFDEKVGTPSYIAPQICNNYPIKKQQIFLVDVYSIGVIYYELLNLFNKATKHQRAQKLNFLKQNNVDLPNQFLQEERKLIKLLTKGKNRPNIQQIYSKKQYLLVKAKYSHK